MGIYTYRFYDLWGEVLTGSLMCDIYLRQNEARLMAKAHLCSK